LQATAFHRRKHLSVTQKLDINDKGLRLGWRILAVIAFGTGHPIRIRLLGIPLDRDAGEYGYAARLRLQGIQPYKLAYNMLFSDTYAGYAMIMSTFGQTISRIHLGLLPINAGTIVLIFFPGRQLLNSIVRLAAGTSYAVLSVSPSVLGRACHAAHTVLRHLDFFRYLSFAVCHFSKVPACTVSATLN
jgi:hypothetical protein